MAKRRTRKNPAEYEYERDPRTGAFRPRAFEGVPPGADPRQFDPRYQDPRYQDPRGFDPRTDPYYRQSQGPHRPGPGFGMRRARPAGAGAARPEYQGLSAAVAEAVTDHSDQIWSLLGNISVDAVRRLGIPQRIKGAAKMGAKATWRAFKHYILRIKT